MYDKLLYASEDLLNTLDSIFEDPNFQSVFLCAGINGFKYSEPKELREQLETLRSIINNVTLPKKGGVWPGGTHYSNNPPKREEDNRW